MWRKLRIAVLLSILAIVSLGTWWQSNVNENWDKTFRITIYPVSNDGSTEVSNYINSLSANIFSPIPDFLQKQAADYGLPFQPRFYLSLGPVIKEKPPAPPRQRSAFNMIKWSAKLRYWLFNNTGSVGLDSRHIRIFILYHQYSEGKLLAHSYGLQKGLLGVVNAFAGDEDAGSNNVIIAHELLHIYGASDKYGHNNLPLYPDGYANPEQYPLYPQTHAEIMGGRIAINRVSAVIPDSLDRCVIGPKTASEIKWY